MTFSLAAKVGMEWSGIEWWNETKKNRDTFASTSQLTLDHNFQEKVENLFIPQRQQIYRPSFEYVKR